MKFDGDVDLGGYSIKAKNGTFSGDVVAKTMTANAFVGDGSGLTGVKLGAAACKTGQVVRGIAADGSLLCTAGGGDVGAATGGLLSTEFTDAQRPCGVQLFGGDGERMGEAARKIHRPRGDRK